MVTKVGLDLGYANITLSDVTATVYREPSVALVDKSNHSIITVGASAENVQNPNAVIVRPFKNGLLYNSEYTRGVIAAVVSSLKATDKIRLVLGVPSSYLPKQERELLVRLKLNEIPLELAQEMIEGWRAEIQGLRRRIEQEYGSPKSEAHRAIVRIAREMMYAHCLKA